MHQYLNYSQVFIEPDSLSVRSAILDTVCVRVSALLTLRSSVHVASCLCVRVWVVS